MLTLGAAAAASIRVVGTHYMLVLERAVFVRSLLVESFVVVWRRDGWGDRMRERVRRRSPLV